MSDAVIRVENLGKKYQLGRAAGQNGAPYRTLRDTLSDGARNLFRNPRSALGDSANEEFWALRDIGFEVKQGEVIGIIGRNGAGKSTLLKILSRITEPTTGRIAIKGRVASLLEVGTGFHPELTGRENIYLNGAILGMTRAEIMAKFNEIVSFAEIDKFLDTPVKRYSSGMYVRLAFAVAAHLEPEILVVDEVLAVGDAEFQKKCLGKMHDVSRGGRTVLFVSHNMEALLRMCSRALLLRAGAMAAFSETKSVVEMYLRTSSEQPRIAALDTKPRFPHLRLGGRYTAATLLGTADATPWVLPFGAEFALRLTLRLDRTLEDPEIGVSIFSATGIEIISSLSSMSRRWDQWSAGAVSYTVRLPTLKLVPGQYHVAVGLRSTRGMEDHLVDAFEFEVGTSEESSALRTDTLAGFIVPQVDCAVECEPAREVAGSVA